MQTSDEKGFLILGRKHLRIPPPWGSVVLSDELQYLQTEDPAV